MKNKSLIVASLLTAVTGAVMLGATPAKATENNSIEEYCDYPLSIPYKLEEDCVPKDQGGSYTS